MSYICLLINENGAVAGADSRESFYSFAHLDWRRKCFSLPERKLVWACCGPTLRLGVDFFRATEVIFRGSGTVREQLERIGALVAKVTSVPVPGGKLAGSFCLLAAQWEAGGFTVWELNVAGKQPVIRRRRAEGRDAVSLHSGAWHREMPPLPSAELVGLSYDGMKALAEERVALAIRKDAERRQRDKKYHPSIGGRVRIEGIRLRR